MKINGLIRPITNRKYKISYHLYGESCGHTIESYQPSLLDAINEVNLRNLGKVVIYESYIEY